MLICTGHIQRNVGILFRGIKVKRNKESLEAIGEYISGCFYYAGKGKEGLKWNNTESHTKILQGTWDGLKTRDKQLHSARKMKMQNMYFCI